MPNLNMNLIVFPTPKDGSVNLDVSSARLFTDREAQDTLKTMPNFRLNNINEASLGTIFGAEKDSRWTVKLPEAKLNTSGDNYIFVKEYDEFKSHCIEKGFLSENPSCVILKKSV